MRRALLGLAAAIVLGLLAFAVIIFLNERETESLPSSPPLAGQVERGAYLARAGNCLGCHTTPGGIAYAGGRELPTPFGTFVTPNITPDRETGLGAWTADEFWRALHYGKGRDGRPLYPAFPYTEYTRVTREDADALFAYLQSLPASANRVADTRLNFPYSVRPLLYAWRALYFTPGVFKPDAAHDAEWNRGAYLVQGLGHCNACHGARNALGAAGGAALGGGQVAGRSWYAPSLAVGTQSTIEELSRLLSTGTDDKDAAAGPMAEVVSQSLQHLDAADLKAMSVYLRSLSAEGVHVARATATSAATTEETVRRAKGEKLYVTHCRDCHGASGEGSPGAYPALAGNRSVNLASPTNTVRSILDGGYIPPTRANPRPYGMPPFAQSLSNEEVAQIATFIRTAWGNRGTPVSALQVDNSGSD